MGEKLTRQQRRAVKLVLGGRSVLLVGLAGMGKTATIKHVLQACEAKMKPGAVALTAMTANAAQLLPGSAALTLHRFMGVKPDRVFPGMTGAAYVQRTRPRKEVVDRVRHTSVLVVDEVSMLSAELFTLMHGVACALRKTDPDNGPLFGGMTLLLTGDLLQLPPVGRVEQYLFDAPVARAALEADPPQLAVVALDRTFRAAADPAYAALVGRAAMGALDPADIQLLRDIRAATVRQQQGPGADAINSVLHVYGRNAQVNAHNEHCLEQLAAPPVRFGRTAWILAGSGHPDASRLLAEYVADSTNVPATLTLKAGAKVLMTVNVDPDNGYVNGTRGVVLAITPRGDVVFAADDAEQGLADVAAELVDAEGAVATDVAAGRVRPTYPLGHRVALVPPYTRRRTHDLDRDENGVPKTVVELGITAMPFALGYAVTAHRAQGLGIERVAMMVTDCFVAGQGYVMLSRYKPADATRQHLHLLGVDTTKIYASPRALWFYRTYAPDLYAMLQAGSIPVAQDDNDEEDEEDDDVDGEGAAAISPDATAPSKAPGDKRPFSSGGPSLPSDVVAKWARTARQANDAARGSSPPAQRRAMAAGVSVSLTPSEADEVRRAMSDIMYWADGSQSQFE